MRTHCSRRKLGRATVCAAAVKTAAMTLGVAPFLLRPIVYRDDELQSRPHLGHGADFDIDEPASSPL